MTIDESKQTEPAIPPSVGNREAAEILRWDRREVAIYQDQGLLPEHRQPALPEVSFSLM